MELKMPTADQAHWGLRAMKTVALADGVLNDAEAFVPAGSPPQMAGSAV